MDSTPKIKVRRFVGGILTSAVVGLTAWGGNIGSAPIKFAVEESVVQVNGHNVKTVPAGSQTASGLQTAGSNFYQPVASWGKTKHWLKRNAPIVGGAGGGALVGGLVGGGTGAVVGGAVGAGGGYLYKRHREHRRQQYYQQKYYQQHRKDLRR